MRRSIDNKRTELRAASRGLPRLQDIVSLPRQRLDDADRRLGRGLLANVRAHAMREAKIGARLNPRLIETRLHRAHDRLDTLGRRSAECLARIAGQRRSRLERVSGRLNPEIPRARIARCMERVTELDFRAGRALVNRVSAWRRAVEGHGQLLTSLSYQSVLRRGFALVRDASGRPVRSVAQVTAGALLEIELGDGRLDTQVLGATPAGTAEEKQAAPPKPARKTSGAGGGPQGTLF